MGETESNVPIPLHSYILLRSERSVKNATTAGGIALPDSATKDYAIVIAVGVGEWGPDGKRQAPQVKPGDRVMIDAPQGVSNSFWWGGKKYISLRECFISAILPGEEAQPQPDESRRLVTPEPPTRLIM